MATKCELALNTTAAYTFNLLYPLCIDFRSCKKDASLSFETLTKSKLSDDEANLRDELIEEYIVAPIRQAMLHLEWTLANIAACAFLGNRYNEDLLEYRLLSMRTPFQPQNLRLAGIATGVFIGFIGSIRGNFFSPVIGMYIVGKKLYINQPFVYGLVGALDGFRCLAAPVVTSFFIRPVVSNFPLTPSALKKFFKRDDWGALIKYSKDHGPLSPINQAVLNLFGDRNVEEVVTALTTGTLATHQQSPIQTALQTAISPTSQLTSGRGTPSHSDPVYNNDPSSSDQIRRISSGDHTSLSQGGTVAQLPREYTNRLKEIMNMRSLESQEKEVLLASLKEEYSSRNIALSSRTSAIRRGSLPFSQTDIPVADDHTIAKTARRASDNSLHSGGNSRKSSAAAPLAHTYGGASYRYSSGTAQHGLADHPSDDYTSLDSSVTAGSPQVTPQARQVDYGPLSEAILRKAAEKTEQNVTVEDIIRELIAPPNDGQQIRYDFDALKQFIKNKALTEGSSEKDIIFNLLEALNGPSPENTLREEFARHVRGDAFHAEDSLRDTLRHAESRDPLGPYIQVMMMPHKMLP